MLETYQREFADFNSALNREYYLYFSGQKPRFEISEIYSLYSDLFTLDAIDSLKKKRDEIGDYYETERSVIERLIIFATENYLSYKVKELSAEIANVEASSKIELEGKTVPFQKIANLLASDHDRERRLKLYRYYVRLIDSINNLRAERIEKLHDLSARIGYDNYLQLYTKLRRVNYTALDEQMQRFLIDTEKIYTIELERMLRLNLRISSTDADRADSFYFTQLNSFDHIFPVDLLLPAYRETMSSLRIYTYRQKNIEIDRGGRPNKNSGAFCAPIVIPQEIKLMFKPEGGLSNFEHFFHEAGHAQHFGFTASDLLPEFKYGGDYALTETYAFLLSHLVSDPNWLEYILKTREAGELPKAVMLAKLYLIRRHAAKLHYEIGLHSGLASAKASDIYEENLTAATKFRFYKSEYLSDLDDGFNSANYLRAWMFEAMLRDYLMTRYGRRWWSNHKAGDFLKELWNTGNRYTADELAAQIGLGPILIEPLEVELLVALRS
jgi:hypothetical protein